MHLHFKAAFESNVLRLYLISTQLNFEIIHRYEHSSKPCNSQKEESSSIVFLGDSKTGRALDKLRDIDNSAQRLASIHLFHQWPCPMHSRES